jgi:large subunit ribosomal protein L25
VADFSIEAQPRTVTGKKVGQLRRDGFIPATIYGPKTAAVSVQFPYRALELTLARAGGTSLIDIVVDGTTYVVVAREVQRDTIKRTIDHVDFFAVDLATKVRADIPLHLIGESPAVLAKKGVLMTGTTSITVEVLPGKLMRFIEIDLSGLEDVGDSIHVSDLNLPDDATIINEPEELLVRVAQTGAARSEEDEAAEAEAELSGSEPEVIHKGKEEDDF